jgi:O-antigen/teichoic acid export membrane protein
MEAWLHLPHAFGFVMFPLLAREFYRSKQSTHDILIRTTRRLFSIVTPVIVGIILFSEEIILLLYGETFLDAIPLVRLLMLSFLLICGDVLLGNTCRALERQNFDLAVLAVTATVNVALNLLLIPHYGLVGACCATIISMGVSLVTHWYYVRSRVFELDWMGAFLKPLALVIPSTLAVVIFRRKIDPLLLTGIFLGSYSLGLWLTKGSLRRP